MKAHNTLNYVNDYLDSEDFENYAQDAFWRRDFNEDYVLGVIQSNANQDLLFLVDFDENIELIYKLIVEAYKTKEKGLS